VELFVFSSLVNPRVLLSTVVSELGPARLFRVEWNKRWGLVPPINLEKKLSSFLLLLSKTQKDQKYFRCFSLFVSLAFYLWFALLAIFDLVFEKSKNIFLCSLSPFALVSKIENPKIFVVLLRFCKVCCRVQSLVTPLELGIHLVLFKPHK
jgi:hypothetical protein